MRTYINKIACIILALFSLMIIISMMSVIVIFLGLKNSDKIAKKEFNNPIIDNDYQEWGTVILSEDFAVKVPQHWQFERIGDISHINSQENTIGFCALIQKSSLYQDIQDVLGAIVGFDVIEIETEYLSTMLCIGQADLAQLDVHGQAETIRVYRLMLVDGDKKCVFIFPNNEAIDVDELIDFSEAIVYSWVFPQK